MRYFYLFIITFFLLTPGKTSACERDTTLHLEDVHGCFEPSGQVHKRFVPPPFSRLKNGALDADQKSEFELTLVGFPSAEAEEAFRYAVSIWEATLPSMVPIRVLAVYSNYLSESALAGCSPYAYRKNFEGVPVVSTAYPMSLSQKIRYEVDEEDYWGWYDMSIVINGERDDFYYGTDGDTPEDSYDFVTVVLHELAHGLGFQGYASYNGFTAGTGYTIFDRFMVDGEDQYLYNYDANETNAFYAAVTTGELFFNGPLASEANNNAVVPLYTPSTFASGSSIYHLDEGFDDGTNNLMTNSLDYGEAIHSPGPVTLGILYDMGWDIVDVSHMKRDVDDPLVDTFVVAFTAYSEYDMAAEDMFVKYRPVGGVYDTAEVVHLSGNSYQAVLENLVYNTEYQYNITVKDTKDGAVRSYTYPADKTKPCRILFGADETLPVISSITSDTAVWLPYADGFKVWVDASDNTGIASVKVLWAINGVDQTPVSMSYNASDALYEASVTLPADIDVEDVISYVIEATDASSLANTRTYPKPDSATKSIALVNFTPIDASANYENDFEDQEANGIFYLEGMEINRPSDTLNSMSLNTPHPYTSPSYGSINYKATFCHELEISNNMALSFDEIVLVEPGSDGIAYPSFYYYDYAVLEYSVDSGSTWQALIPGYDSNEDSRWLTAWNSWLEDGESMPPNSYAAGVPSLYLNRQIHLTDDTPLKAGDVALIRFRMYSDNIIYGWGWSIDNFKVLFDVPSNVPVKKVSAINLVPNPAQDYFYVNNVGSATVQLYTTTGTLVKSEKVYGSEPIYIGDLQEGIYLAYIKTNSEITSLKLIKSLP